MCVCVRVCVCVCVCVLATRDHGDVLATRLTFPFGLLLVILKRVFLTDVEK